MLLTLLLVICCGAKIMSHLLTLKLKYIKINFL